ncbi:uncharacterized protein BT62DRAFT_945292 [Guyanagaster necrorhizus]|uniref:Membrane anchor Opy2 N-terminal domain-containing protein n=1 Tax=Guyanagaster necrorhizus TaxID=856835 RepID=A0A9P7VZE4_9AGAR|nr:uncharacterized protein BT62DRAFT_945292 [Guyanagaster necrorhizus MCA 3950]KAG7449220.1 hypothetical protein BT62DRAFT_945292 [Guyanagaster necrorhizus MCA 3950]
MRLDALLPRQSSSCIDCPETPVCSCAANQECFQISRDCYTCSTFTCVSQDSSSSSSSSSGGVSKGALAGAIVGALVFLGGAIFLFLWWRRSTRRRRALEEAEAKPDAPAPAETVLNRPDPTEKPSPTSVEQNTVRVYSSSSNTTIDLDPESQTSSHPHSPESTRSNPFEDSNSIQTAGTEGTNVIPIALVPPDPSSHASSHSELSNIASPVRPPRSPDLNLEHVNVSHDTLRTPQGYALSQRSGVSGVSSRQSYMSNASYSSDFLNEAPMIITPGHGTVRQVLGVVKAEVINAPGPNDGLRTPGTASRPMTRSPLAATSFGPADIMSGDELLEGNPFSDRHSSTATTHATSPDSVQTAFSPTSPTRESNQMNWTPDSPLLPWAQDGDNSRPSSMSTQAGSIIGIENATRVNVGLLDRSPSYRTTKGRLVTPSTAGLGTLEEQQQRALAHAQARAQAQGLDKNKRASGSSVLSATSTRADSILESFPFVPPSPISNRPMRSPPVSPMGQSFSGGPSSPNAQQSFLSSSTQATVVPSLQGNSFSESETDLPSPPSRRTLGLSTGSQLSTASSGLGSFPFQIDTGNSGEPSSMPSVYSGRQRASLDTLAITSDLSSYPLGFDRDSILPPSSKRG